VLRAGEVVYSECLNAFTQCGCSKTSRLGVLRPGEGYCAGCLNASLNCRRQLNKPFRHAACRGGVLCLISTVLLGFLTSMVANQSSWRSLKIATIAV
jgi:hypothetical protein